MLPSPFSSSRHASASTFRGYGQRQPGVWSLGDVRACLGSGALESPSFWVAGGPKAGKTSFVLRLENLLLQHPEPLGPRLLPLYVNLGEHDSLLSFGLSLVQRAMGVIPKGQQTPHASHLESSRLSRLENATPYELLRALLLDLADCVEALELPTEQTRLVWLLDNVDQVVRSEWARPLFLFLRELVERPDRSPFVMNGCRGGVGLVLTGDRQMAEIESPARDLLNVLEEVTLRPLDWHAVRGLAENPSQLSLKLELVSRIYSASAGQPWLVQFLFETLVEVYQRDASQFDAQFESITTTRFAKIPDADKVLQEWFHRLPEPSVRLLAHLCISDEPLGDADLAHKANVDPRTLRGQLRRMLELGIVFQAQSEGLTRYGLSSIFKRWYLRHTGGGVFLDVLRPEGKRGGAASLCPGAFTLFLGPDAESILVEGLAARYLTPQNPERAKDDYRALCTPPESPPDRAIRGVIASALRSCLAENGWSSLWADYVERAVQAGLQPEFVLQLDRKCSGAVNLPIELLPMSNSFLGQQVPLYLELLGSGQEPCFRRGDGLLPAGKLNLLIVGSSRKLRYGAEHFAPLPLAEQELAEIISAVTAWERPLGRRLGRIVLLSDGELAFSAPVEKHSPTTETFERALRGELGDPMHLLHYSGHYVAGGQESSSGLLFERNGQGELFDLRRLGDSLGQHQIRFVFLNACRSGHHTPQGLQYLGAAETLLSKGVPAVVGMRWPIADSEGMTLAKAFYRDLAVSLRPELALWSARREAAKIQDSLAWAAPVMLTR